ncbi:S41 family peptidase [Maribellus maritimus]|uniref:hypothetical protein n=1 Tax=Maribellus maritimus TaxID=2870838 RepID=UPI001EEBFADA|nr:hypothetical protein [Maribellus maritimus]MCG6185910.1 hypothetical protein [Maribellus maritimus]
MRSLFFAVFTTFIFLCSCKPQKKEEPQSQKTRLEKWSEDIAYFENNYLENSRTFDTDSIAACKKILDGLKSQLDSLTDNQIILSLSKCVAKANNGHTTIHLSKMDKIPLRYYWFADGLYIIKTDTSIAEHLGSKILKINSLEIDSVYKQLKDHLSGINRFKKFTASNYLTSPEILNGIGLTAADSLTLTLLKGKDTSVVNFKVKKMPDSKYEYESWADLYPDSAKTTPWAYFTGNSNELPLYLKHMNEGVFYTFLDAEEISYFSINALWYKSPDFKEKIKKFLSELKTKTDYHVVFDLRYYTGGNYVIPAKLATQPPKIIDDNRKIYLITSSMTFSAGLVTAARIKYFGKNKVVIVGEEVGDHLKFWAEGDYYTLPNSNISIQDSKYEHDWKNNKFIPGQTFWLNLFYGVAAKNLKVNKEIKLRFENYRNNQDPIMEWIKNEVTQNP